MSAPGEQPEIIIIRRNKGGHHDGHHGGVWKIAYADFVTAMMAFFLVMWLINASNEETKAAVASYFNPIQLMDTTSNPKGVKDASYGASEDDPTEQSPPVRLKSDEMAQAGEGAPAVESEDMLFADPYAVLAEIAGGQSPSAASTGDQGGGLPDLQPRPGMMGGEAFRDPFQPDYWAEPDAKPAAAPVTESVAPEPADAPPEGGAEQEAPAAIGSSEASAATAPDAAAEVAPDPNVDPDPAKRGEALAELVQAKLKATGTADAPSITVRADANGDLVIDMTDGLAFEMFEIGSARPKREAIAAVERIAVALADVQGSITIGGHTDARPFRNETYDNWRLSSARAQMAYHMLVRAGVDDRRIGAVTGHADRQPKNAEDPLSAENRRIEIRVIQAANNAQP